MIVLYLAGAILLILFLPVRGARHRFFEAPVHRMHEADAVLSRRLLEPGTPAYDAYYRDHPQLQEADDLSRSKPGLLSERTSYYHPSTFAAAKINFELIDALGNLCLGNPSEKKQHSSPAPYARFIRQWLLKTGAHSVGFTSLKDYHLYSHKGRGPDAGKEIKQVHGHAIAICVEMDHRMMQSAPQGSAVMESSEQYLRSAVLAIKLAAWIRELGYEARAHIDGNYEVICPLVAADAGLGTMGRMGLLITPKLGPRVRIAVVTTSLPLPKGPARTHRSAFTRSCIHFCELCKKCAQVCPTAAIPDGDRKRKQGVKRWQIDSEKCYHYWTLSGTDCGRCMAVCPFSHPDDAFHRFIRWGIKNNLLFRYLAIKLDDVFYGRKPSIRPLPVWTQLFKTK